MSQPIQNPQVARHVRALYNYNVGQKAILGWIVLAVFLAVFGALAFAGIGSLVSGLLSLAGGQ